MVSENEPKTLHEAVKYFADPDNCREYIVRRRWPNGVTCPRCGDARVVFQPKYNRWQCAVHHPLRQFTVKVGTVMEDSPIALEKWLMTMWLVANCKNGVSSYEIARDLGVTQKSAWFMLHRCRLGMQDEQHGGKLGGEVEVDETFIGGKARNMHKDRKRRAGINGPSGPAAGDKAIVHGILERDGVVRLNVVPDRSKDIMQGLVRQHVEEGSTVMTDTLLAYYGLHKDYTHETIDHANAYVCENVHTNGLENFWSCLKRTINGTYVSVEPFHLFRYLDEQAYRYNNRKPMDDSMRFSMLVRKIVGKRLTYAELTGKNEDSALSS